MTESSNKSSIASMPRIDVSSVQKLTGSNYRTWKFQIKLLLQSYDAYNVTIGVSKLEGQFGGDQEQEWKRRDLLARNIISSSLDSTQISRIADCDSAFAMWTALAGAFDDKSAFGRNALFARYHAFKINRTKNLVDAFTEIEEMVANLREMNAKIEDSEVVTKIVALLPDDYKHLKAAWDSVPEESQTMQNLLQRLKKEEAEKAQKTAEQDERQNNKAYSAKGNPNKTANTDGTTQTRGKKKGKPGKRPKCNYCQKLGHLEAKCWRKQSDEGQKVTDPNQRKSGNFSFFADEGYPDMDLWYHDSGCTTHMCGRREWFTKYEPHNEEITLASSQKVVTEGIGEVEVRAKIGKRWTTVTLRNVRFINGMRNLFSEPVLIKKGYSVQSNKSGAVFIDSQGRKTISSHFNGHMFIMNFKPISNFAGGALTGVNKAKLWHDRFAHVSINAIVDTVKNNAVTGIDSIENQRFFCEDCQYGKLSRLPYEPSEPKSQYLPGEKVHMDLAGPFPTASLRGSKYFLLIKDDASNFKCIYFIKTKDKVKNNIEVFVTWIQNQTGRKLKVVKTDCGLEFTNDDVAEIFAKFGITHETSAPYCPQQNGRAERDIRTIKETARTLLKSAKLPDKLWAEAVACAVYIHNRVINKRSGTVTPYEMVFGQKPDVSHLRAFGSDVYSHIPEIKRTVWESKAEKLILVGYDGPNYRLYNPSKLSVIIARNIKVNEKFEPVEVTFPVPQNSITPGRKAIKTSTPKVPKKKSENIKVENISVKDAVELFEKAINQASENTNSDSRDDFQDDSEMEMEQNNGASQQADEFEDAHTIQQNEPAPLVELADTGLTANTRYNLRNRENLRKPDKYGHTANLVFNENKACVEPLSYKEAMESPEQKEWLKAMKDEMNSHKVNGTWTLVPRPSKPKALTGRWVFRHKYHLDGSIKQYKARYVVKGYLQKPGIDYEETFAPVARHESIRLLLALAASDSMKIGQFDVKTAFLYGILKEEIYMEQPEGFIDESKPNHVCKLIKSLYGLKQAPLCWNNTFKNFLAKFNFSQSNCDPCVFIGSHNKSPVFICIYVDDGLIFAKNEMSITTVMDEIAKQFEIKIEPAENYIGFEITQNDDGSISIGQSAYIRNILRRFNMEECKAVSVPMQPGNTLEPVDECASVPYRELIGSLIFLATTARPDITFAVSYLSRFMSRFNEEHWNAAKYILRYLNGTIDLGITYAPGPLNMIGYVDADYAGDKSDFKSTSGYAFNINGSAISWASQKQPIIALSSTEAEYIALCAAATESIWLSRFLEELGKNVEPVQLNVDNQSAIHLANNPSFHKRSKHIAVRYHYTRELVRNNRLKIKHCASSDQVADVLTKPLLRQKHALFRKGLGMGNSKSKAVGKKSILLPLALICLGSLCSARQWKNEPLDKAGNVVWRRTDIFPVNTGIYDVSVNINLESPCEIIKPGEDYLTRARIAAYHSCVHYFDKQVLKPFGQLCPESCQPEWEHFTESPGIHHRHKRDPITATVAIGSVIAIIGVGISGLIVGLQNTNKINDILGDNDHIRQKIHGMLTSGEYDRQAVEHLQGAIMDLSRQSDLLEQKFSDVAIWLVNTTYAISKMMNEFNEMEKLVHDSIPEWKRDEVPMKLLRYFNITNLMQCGNSCPFQRSHRIHCSMCNNSLSLRFNTPKIDPNYRIYTADPFELMVSAGNKTCRIDYIGPKQIVFSNNECVYPYNAVNPDSFILRRHECVKWDGILDALVSTHQIKTCYESSPKDAEDFFQVKFSRDHTYVYCPGKNVSFLNEMRPCGDYPFWFYSRMNFTVGDYVYNWTRLYINNSVVLEGYNEKINKKLNTTIDLDSIRKHIEAADQLLEMSRNVTKNTVFIKTNHDSHLMATALILISLTILFLVIKSSLAFGYLPINRNDNEDMELDNRHSNIVRPTDTVIIHSSPVVELATLEPTASTSDEQAKAKSDRSSNSTDSEDENRDQSEDQLSAGL